MQIIYPLSEDERERMQIPEQEFGGDGTLGIILTPSDIRRGIRRWLKQGRPDMFRGEEVSEGIYALHEDLSVAHKTQLEKQKQVLLDEFEVQATNLTDAHAQELANQKNEAKRHKDTYERRIQVKNKQLLEFRDDLKAEREKVQTYHTHFGEIRSHPLNWLQRFMGRLFRILP